MEKERAKQYIGKKIELVRMDDPQAPPRGTKGEVWHVDDRGQLHVRWENGSGLALIPGIDKFIVLS